jgi:signal transduction histidine kinase
MNAGLRRDNAGQPRENLSWRDDLALPVGVAAVALAGTAMTASHLGPHPTPGVMTWVSVTLGPLALVFRRRHPVVVLWTTFAATLLTPAPAFAFASLIVALFGAATSGHRRAAWTVTGIGYIGAVWLMPLAWGQPVAALVSALLLAAWLAVLLVAAEAVRWRREATAQRRAARQFDARRLASEERLRMARELHDVIGHTISLINVQAAVGLDLMDTQPEQGRAALSAIKKASKQALDELRAMIAALSQADEKGPRSPVPGLARLPELISLTSAAGLTVTADVAGQPRPLPATVDLAAYRIVQEALTNVTRHAGLAAVTIRVIYGDDDISIHVDDDGRPARGEGHGAQAGGSGSGIPGMRARAAALGGRFEAGPQPGGGFRVHAVLPLSEAP